jgi:cytochrome c peroxidase
MKILITISLLLLSTTTLANEAVEALGEKLFNDPRFSRHFYEASGQNPNFPLDSIVQPEKLTSCASCHQIDQQFEDIGMRGYSDFVALTPLAISVDGQDKALRNTPALIGIGSRYSRHQISHHDGELVHSETYLGNFLGPHMGWAKSQKEQSLDFIVKILRDDLGNPGKGEFSYRQILLGIDPALPEELRLPSNWLADIDKLTDKELIETMVKAGSAYLQSIDFATDESGEYIGSPYDEFLKANKIDRGPKATEDSFQYAARIRGEILNLKRPVFIAKKYYETHKQSFEFGTKEFNGLKAFLGSARCINCHTPPLFTDQSFHNVGISQRKYDKKYGQGSFMQQEIPVLAQRDNQDIILNQDMDLGVWNFFAKKDKDILTKFIRSQFCRDLNNCNNDELLTFMVARMKTPTLRNLSMSNPYFHDGYGKDLKAVLIHYRDFSEKVRKGEVLNPAPQMRMMQMSDEDISNLEAFLKALNEDYD